MVLQGVQEAPAGVEHRPPEVGAQVRILPGAHPLTSAFVRRTLLRFANVGLPCSGLDELGGAVVTVAALPVGDDGPARPGRPVEPEHAGEARHRGMERLLSSGSWDAEDVLGDVRDWALRQLGQPGAVLEGEVLDR
jgi:hypothetical protein